MSATLWSATPQVGGCVSLHDLLVQSLAARFITHGSVCAAGWCSMTDRPPGRSVTLPLVWRGELHSIMLYAGVLETGGSVKQITATEYDALLARTLIGSFPTRSAAMRAVEGQ